MSINTQFSYEDGSWYDSNMIIIKDIDSAQTAIGTIVEQGEGSTSLRSPPLPKLPNSGRVLEPTPPVANRSHFEVFQDLHSGPKLDYHNFIQNPKTSDLEKDEAYSVRCQLTTARLVSKKLPIGSCCVRRRILLFAYID